MRAALHDDALLQVFRLDAAEKQSSVLETKLRMRAEKRARETAERRAEAQAIVLAAQGAQFSSGSDLLSPASAGGSGNGVGPFSVANSRRGAHLPPLQMAGRVNGTVLGSKPLPRVEMS